jgi:hypothetical protein
MKKLPMVKDDWNNLLDNGFEHLPGCWALEMKFHIFKGRNLRNMLLCLLLWRSAEDPALRAPA